MSTDHAQDALDLPGLELPTGSQSVLVKQDQPPVTHRYLFPLALAA